MNNEKEFPQRKRLRLKNFDYSSSGAYFITICTKDRRMLFAPVGADSISARMGLKELSSKQYGNITALIPRYMLLCQIIFMRSLRYRGRIWNPPLRSRKLYNRSRDIQPQNMLKWSRTECCLPLTNKYGKGRFMITLYEIGTTTTKYTNIFMKTL